MIAFKCIHCQTAFRVSDAKAGKKGKCPRCGHVIAIPKLDAPPSAHAPARLTPVAAEAPAPSGPSTSEYAPAPDDESSYGLTLMPKLAEAQPAAAAVAPGDAAMPGGKGCPSCGRALPAVAKVCVNCGIFIRNGRPILSGRGADEDALEIWSERIIKPLSWVLCAGLYPVHSEAHGKSRPYATWAIALLTVLVTVWFWSYEWTGSTKMRTMKNLMLWTGDAKPQAERIVLFYTQTSYGDPLAFFQKREDLAAAKDKDGGETAAKDEDDALVPTTPEGIALTQSAYEAMTPEQRSLGQFRASQLITCAFLHGDIMHLAGNMIFLLVFMSRVNTAVGNIGTVILYALLAVGSGIAQCISEAARQPTPTVGASGAIMGMAGMYLVLYPLHKMHLLAWIRLGLFTGFKLFRKVFAVKGIYVVLFYLAFDVVSTVLGRKDNVAHWAHMGGAAVGVGLALTLLAARLVYSRCDLLSMALGKYAWPILGKPSAHENRGAGMLGYWLQKVRRGDEC